MDKLNNPTVGILRSNLRTAGRLFLSILLLMVGEISLVFSQTGTTISGQVKDAEGTPLIGATVLVKGTSRGVITDTQGNYTIEASTGKDTLIFSYVGYVTKEIAVGNQTKLNVSLEPEALGIEEMVVIGYGTQSKKSVTGAVVEVKPSKNQYASLGTNAALLQGLAPGISVVNNGGDPSSDPFVRIRGIGSINSEGPLWVVDGVIYSGAYVNNNDIESISVLKDASASIYGARASGGVILVTTKKGSRDKLTVDVDAKFGLSVHGDLYQPLNAQEFLEMTRRAYTGDGLAIPSAFDPADENFYWDGQITRTNWVEELFRVGKTQEYNLSIRTGGEKHRVYIGGQYRRDDGIMLSSFSEAYSFRGNSDFDITPWLKIGETFSIAYTTKLGTPVNGVGGVIQQALSYPPSASVYNADGSYGGVSPEKYAGYFGDLQNPVATLKRRDSNNRYIRTMVNPYVEVKLFTPGLKFKSNFSYEYLQNHNRTFTFKALEPGKKVFDNELSDKFGKAIRLVAEQLLTYDRTFGDHSLSLLLGYTYQSDQNYTLGASATTFLSEEEYYRMFINSTMDEFTRPENSFSEERMLSYVGRASYNYKQKYLFSATLRRDGSSKLIGANRWVYYPSFSGGWVLSEEKFMKNVKPINYAKIRISWGQLGNLSGLGRYGFNETLSQSVSIIGENHDQLYGYIFNRPSNPNLRWERSEQFNVGLDMSMFDNKLSITADYFRKVNRDMITTQTINPMTGYANGPQINFGQVTNRGFELALGYTDKIGEVNYDIQGTFSTLKNNFDKYLEGLTYIQSSAGGSRYMRPVWSKVGYPLYSYWGYQTDGLFQSEEEVAEHTNSQGIVLQPNARPGDIRYIDQNDDGKLDTDDRVYLGNPYPKYEFGLNVTVRWRSFDFNMFWQGNAGLKLYNAAKELTMQSAMNGANTSKLALQAWNPEDPEGSRGATVPRLSTRDDNGNFSNPSDFFVESGNFLKLRNLAIGYNLPTKWLTKLSIQNVRVMFSCQNLLTITNYSGIDPEVGLSNQGIDAGVYPIARTFTLGLNLTF